MNKNKEHKIKINRKQISTAKCCCADCLNRNSHTKLLRAVHSCKMCECCMSEGAHEKMHICVNVHTQVSIVLHNGMMRWVQEPMPPHGVGCQSRQNL